MAFLRSLCCLRASSIFVKKPFVRFIFVLANSVLTLFLEQIHFLFPAVCSLTVLENYWRDFLRFLTIENEDKCVKKHGRFVMTTTKFQYKFVSWDHAMTRKINFHFSLFLVVVKIRTWSCATTRQIVNLSFRIVINRFDFFVKLKHQNDVLFFSPLDYFGTRKWRNWWNFTAEKLHFTQNSTEDEKNGS